MKSVTKAARKSKKNQRNGEIPILRMEEYQEMSINTKAELIQSLIPLGLMHISGLLQDEVRDLAGERYGREGREPGRSGMDIILGVSVSVDNGSRWIIPAYETGRPIKK